MVVLLCHRYCSAKDTLKNLIFYIFMLQHMQLVSYGKLMLIMAEDTLEDFMTITETEWTSWILRNQNDNLKCINL